MDNRLKIKHIATAQVGYQARGRLRESPDGDYIILRAQDFDSQGRLNLENATRFFAEEAIDPRKYTVIQGDILVQARGQQNVAYYIDVDVENVVASNSFYIIRIEPESGIQPFFLAWWINQSVVQKYFEQEKGISTIGFISLKALLEAPVILPSTEEQNAISELVFLWQKEQDLSQKLIFKKDQLVQAAAMQAVKKIQEVKK